MSKGIYYIKNLINEKCYVGSSKNLHMRKRHHFSSLRHNKHPNQYLQNSWNKYGEENFEFIIIEILPDTTSLEDLLAREQYHIDNKHSEYNIFKIAGSPKGFSHDEKTKLRISKSMKGIRKSAQHAKNISKSQKGKVFTEEHKLKLSKAALNRDPSTTSYKNTKIIINGIVYESLKEASEMTGIKYNTIQKRLANKNFEHYQYYYTKEVKETKSLVKGISFKNKEVIIDGVEYESALKASRVLKIHVDTIKYRIASENFSNYTFK